jgi:arylsulfatase A-like enzyme
MKTRAGRNSVETDERAPSGAGGDFSASDTVRLALWLALGSGLMEGIYRLYQAGLRGQPIGISPHIIWMAPVANLMFLGIALALAAGLGGFRRGRDQRWPVLLLLMLAALGLILLYKGMHKGAAVLLAAGIAWQLAPRIRRSAGMKQLVRRTLPILAAMTVLGWAGIAAQRRIHEWRTVAALPPAPSEAPNVLLLVWDTVRGFNLSLHGYDRPTSPYLERMASQGARFDRAMSTAPWTLPSHGSMFTGRRPAALSGRLNVPMDATHPVIAEAFARAGYVTGGFAANMSYVSREHGLARGFSHYRDFRLSPTGIIGSSRFGMVLLQSDAVRKALGYFDLPGRKDAYAVNQEFLNWVDRQRGRPFFAFLNYFDAHQPYIAPKKYRARFTLDSLATFRPRLVDANYRDMTGEEIRWSMGEYDATIAYLDAELERLMHQMEQRGLLDNTIVVVTSDHGEHFGDHRRVSHGNSLYRQLLQVPLVIRHPATIPPGTVVEHPVSLADLPRTLFDLTRLETGQGFPGRTLARFWKENFPPDGPEVVLSEMPTVKGQRALSLIAEGYHYIRWFGRPPQLYHLKDDPEEGIDLAAASGAATILGRFAKLETRYTESLNDQGD